MSNPYFIRRTPKKDVSEKILPWAHLATQLYGLKQHGDISKQKLSLYERELKGQETERKAKYGTPSEFGAGYEPEGAMPERYGTKGTVQRGLEVNERLARVKEREVTKSEAEIPITEKNFGMDKVALFQTGLAKQGLDKAFAPLIDSMKSIAQDKKFNHRVTYSHFKTNWPTYQKITIEGLQKEMTRVAEINPKRAEELGQIIKEISEDKEGKLIDQAMPATAQAIADEQTALTAKLRPVSPTKIGAPGSHIIDAEGNIIRTLPGKPVKPPTEKTKRGFEEKVASAESNILDEEIKPEKKQPWINYHNRYSNNPYVYIFTKGKKVKWGRDIAANVKKVELPSLNGKQVYAKDVYDTAQKRSVTYEYVLELIGAIR